MRDDPLTDIQSAYDLNIIVVIGANLNFPLLKFVIAHINKDKFLVSHLDNRGARYLYHRNLTDIDFEACEHPRFEQHVGIVDVCSNWQGAGSWIDRVTYPDNLGWKFIIRQAIDRYLSFLSLSHVFNVLFKNIGKEPEFRKVTQGKEFLGAVIELAGVDRPLITSPPRGARMTTIGSSFFRPAQFELNPVERPTSSAFPELW